MICYVQCVENIKESHMLLKKTVMFVLSVTKERTKINMVIYRGE